MHCIGLCVDNNSVNLGLHNSIMTRLVQKNPASYVMGCPCHIVHDIALKASSEFTKVCLIYRLKIAIMLSFSKVTQFAVEDLMIDIYYSFV